MKHEFAIKKQVLNSGRVVHTPVYRANSFGRLRILQTPWTRITRQYDKFKLMDLDFDPDLTFEECEEHIEGFKEQLIKNKENQVKFVEYLKLENKKSTT